MLSRFCVGALAKYFPVKPPLQKLVPDIATLNPGGRGEQMQDHDNIARFEFTCEIFSGDGPQFRLDALDGASGVVPNN